jgi:hypothetical protein
MKATNVNNNRSWCMLITVCAAPALMVALGAAVLFTSAAVTFAVAGSGKPATQGADDPKVRIFSGLITDDHCGARHDMDSDKSPTECTKMCVRNGSRYLLVQGDRRFVLEGNERRLEEQAGQRTNITGSLDGNTIKVSSASAVP